MTAGGKVTGNIEAFNKTRAVGLVCLHLGIYPDPAESAVGAQLPLEA